MRVLTGVWLSQNIEGSDRSLLSVLDLYCVKRKLYFDWALITQQLCKVETCQSFDFSQWHSNFAILIWRVGVERELWGVVNLSVGV